MKNNIITSASFQKPQAKKFIQFLACAFCLLMMGTPLFAQFETTLGIASGNEESWDGKPIAGGSSILLSNTFSFGAGKILLSRLTGTGAQALNVTLHDATYPTVEFSGRAIESDLNATGAHTGYFITGQRKLAAGAQMILLRTDLNGNVTWARFLPSPSLDECGVSVERQSNGDVVATGRSLNPATNISKIVIARFTAAGGLVWCFRYGSSNNLSFVPTEACNGLHPSPNPGGAKFGVVAVTGSYTESGVDGNHTFLFLVNAATGAEIWRRTYNSGNLLDQGNDVVFKPAANQFDADRYMIVGSSGFVHPSVWVVRVTPSNGAGSGSVYSAGVYNSGFIARSVTLSVHSSGTRAALAGTIIGMSQAGNPFFSRAWAMELPFTNNAAPTWTYYYSASDPNGLASESISRITGANPGYLITCGDHLSGSPNFDTHAIRVFADGKHNLADCPEVSLPVTRTAAGTYTTRTNNKEGVSFWNTLSTVRTVRTLVQQSCDGVPFTGGSGERSNENGTATVSLGTEAPTAAIFPNPSSPGMSVRLGVQVPQAQSLTFQIFDLTGKRVFVETKTVEGGYQELDLPSENLVSGAYFVRLQAPDLNLTLKLVVNE